MTKPKKRKIAAVYVFDNGLCAVFDGFGQQMEEYQGVWEEEREKIMEDKPKEVKIFKGKWR
jgi:hypothetical protein